MEYVHFLVAGYINCLKWRQVSLVTIELWLLSYYALMIKSFSLI